MTPICPVWTLLVEVITQTLALMHSMNWSDNSILTHWPICRLKWIWPRELEGWRYMHEDRQRVFPSDLRAWSSYCATWTRSPQGTSVRAPSLTHCPTCSANTVLIYNASAQALSQLQEKWKDDTCEYQYICTRLKAIRQDMTVQRIQNDFMVQVYEMHARGQFCSAYKAYTATPSIPNPHWFGSLQIPWVNFRSLPVFFFASLHFFNVLSLILMFISCSRSREWRHERV